MENKYYTPTIEEFHVGFEFQVLSQDGNRTEDEDWNNQSLGYDSIYDFDEEDWRNNIECYLIANTIRVKHLNREDIESLGWIYDDNISIKFIRLKNGCLYSIAGIYGSKHDSISIYEINEKGTMQFLFQGKIKNKSELQKLIIQLGID